jgi:hypothetical protein
VVYKSCTARLASRSQTSGVQEVTGCEWGGDTLARASVHAVTRVGAAGDGNVIHYMLLHRTTDSLRECTAPFVGYLALTLVCLRIAPIWLHVQVTKATTESARLDALARLKSSRQAIHSGLQVKRKMARQQLDDAGDDEALKYE